METENTWNFSNYELYLLGGLLQLPGFMGLEDPFPGYLTEEIQEHMETARQSLTGRGYLEEAGNEFLIDANLIEAVQTIGTAAKVIATAQNKDSVLVHLAKNCAVWQERLPDGRVGLSKLNNRKDVEGQLRDWLVLPDAPAAPGSGFVVEPAVMEAAQTLVENNHQPNGLSAVKSFLMEKSVPPNAAASLSATLAENHSTGSLMILEREGSLIEPQTRLAWLIGKQGGWVVELPHTEMNPPLEWKPASTSSIVAKVEAILIKL